jgi:23S rRNA (uracil1939-C5)-methyltransferase
VTVTVLRLGHLGDGVADGPVYVAGALPGEVVEGTPEGDRIVRSRIVTPSPDRVKAACPHYRTCGGCSLMHASDGFVAGWKTGVVQTALAAQGLASEFRPVATSPAASRRRATLAGRRTKSGAIVGFHGRASGTITEIPDCRLLHPALIATLPVLRDITLEGASRKGELDLALTLTTGGPDLAVSGGKAMDAGLLRQVARFAEAANLARVTWNGEPAVLRHPPAQRLGRAALVPPAGAFLQATREGEAALVAAMAEATRGAARIADLFAGCGTFALPLAERAEVHAVEGDATMIGALLAGARSAQGLKRVTGEARDLFRRPLPPDELARFDAVVIDPPRAGAEAQCREIARSGLSRVAAVSCNPLSFARDARVLADAGFLLDWVQVVDQFRWSTHVELAALFTRS